MHRFQTIQLVSNEVADRSDPDACWVWPRSCNPKTGYGHFRAERKLHTAHRVSYEYYAAGGLPSGMQVLHKCDNRPCFNPRHLFLGTQRDNMDDMNAKGRGRQGGAQGERHGAAKVTEAIVREIRASSESLDKLVARYGLSKSATCAIRLGRSWKHVDQAVRQSQPV